MCNYKDEAIFFISNKKEFFPLIILEDENTIHVSERTIYPKQIEGDLQDELNGELHFGFRCFEEEANCDPNEKTIIKFNKGKVMKASKIDYYSSEECHCQVQ
ncbi:MAG: hypothetical protein SFU98_06870 [Leptospiraceae bacterium]|nr:hypothetical protein [Leptospiraceae bacterium]